ncbi:iron-sulfur cluster assembly protein [Euzebya tangerina]|uniref:iron-sulfur cluster assembly protein n=1 Tax=Euzebya tangerina TaxID=591198 RepID=UPI0013C2A5C2|nr:iron-sulfur cluster assembly protein [Euzebya tangerina]
MTAAPTPGPDPDLAAGVAAALAEIDDPCLAAAGLPGSITELGLVQGITADSEGVVEVRVALTEIGCAFTHHLIDAITTATERTAGVTSASVQTVWTWVPEQMDPTLRDRLAANSTGLAEQLGTAPGRVTRLPIVTA